MSENIHFEEAVVRMLPQPLVELVRQARNANTLLDLHQQPIASGRAGLKILASVAVIGCDELGYNDPMLVR